ncbi:MAG TPA: IS1 family transposase [Leucothrix sp.]|nr:IS1 family transposase [Leucothrix sp.]
MWIAVDRLGKRFIHVVTGTRGIETGQKLWNEIEDPESMELIATDYWKAYEAFIPQDRHIQSKAETFTVEGYNSLFRHFLARLRRKSKCYSKHQCSH